MTRQKSQAFDPEKVGRYTGSKNNKTVILILSKATIVNIQFLTMHCKFFVIVRYLFNCGEGTQRIFNEQKLKLSKLNNIFLTRICWEYVGGLPGMAMTLRDNGKSEIKLLGPSNLSDFIHATRFFLYHESLKFDCVGFTGSDGEEYKDENLTIWPVIINGRYDQPIP